MPDSFKLFLFSLILTAIKCKSNKTQTKERLNSIYTRPAALRLEAGGGLMATIADSIGSHSNQRGQRDTFQYWPKSNQSERFAYIDEPNQTKLNNERHELCRALLILAKINNESGSVRPILWTMRINLFTMLIASSLQHRDEGTHSHREKRLYFGKILRCSIHKNFINRFVCSVAICFYFLFLLPTSSSSLVVVVVVVAVQLLSSTIWSRFCFVVYIFYLTARAPRSFHSLPLHWPMQQPNTHSHKITPLWANRKVL